MEVCANSNQFADNGTYRFPMTYEKEFTSTRESRTVTHGEYGRGLGQMKESEGGSTGRVLSNEVNLNETVGEQFLQRAQGGELQQSTLCLNSFIGLCFVNQVILMGMGMVVNWEV